MKKYSDSIDCHVHVTESGRWFNTSYNSSVDHLLDEMDRAGIEKSIVLPIKGVTTNAFVISLAKAHGDRLIGFGTASMKTWRDDLKEIVDNDLRGIKFHPRIQHESMMDWEEHGILKAIEKTGLPLIVCGWQQTSSPVATMEKIQPNVIDSIAKKHPNLKIVIAHLGGHRFYDAFFCARGNPNVFLDCSYFFNFFKGTSLEKDALVLMHLADEKILFGSDFPEVNMREYLTFIDEKSQEYHFDLKKMLNNAQKILSHE